jgi:hypothetical protein
MCSYEFTRLLGQVFGICKRAKVFFAKFKADYLFESHFAREELI